MQENFKYSLDAVLQWEGGYVNDPDDPGGATKYGISKNSYPELDIPDISEKQARNIYKRDYWNLCGCEELPAGVDLLVFDTAVNCGSNFAVVTLQQVVGATMDGIFGPKTKKAVAQSDSVKIIAKYFIKRAEYYQELDGFGKFGRGWIRRLSDIGKKALDLKET